MKIPMKRWLAMMLAVILVVTGVPMEVFASTGGEDVSVNGVVNEETGTSDGIDEEKEWLMDESLIPDGCELSWSPGSYAVKLKVQSQQWFYWDTWSYWSLIYTEDEQLAQDFFADSPSVTESQIWDAGYDYSLDSGNGVEWNPESKCSEVNMAFAGGSFKPNTIYYCRLAYAIWDEEEGEYIFSFATVPETLTTLGPVEETKVSLSTLQYQSGYYSATIMWRVDNPYDEYIATSYFVYEGLDEYGEERTLSPYVSDGNPSFYYVRIDISDTIEPIEGRIKTLVYTGEGVETEIVSDLITLQTPMDFTEAEVKVSEASVGIKQFIVDVDVTPFVDEESLSCIVNYRKKGEEAWQQSTSLIRDNVNGGVNLNIPLTGSGSCYVQNLEPGTEYEYYIEIKPSESSEEVFWSNKNSLSSVNIAESVTYEDEQFPDDVFRNYIKNRLGIAETDKITSDALDSLYHLSIEAEDVEAPIKSIEGIQYLKSLTILSLDGHDIRDASKISKLELLGTVTLCNNDLTEMPDISNSRVEYADSAFINNRIAAESITEEKVPEFMKDVSSFISTNVNKQRGELTYTLSDKFYTVDGKQPFSVEVNHFKGGRAYTLTVEVNNKKIEENFSYKLEEYRSNLINYQKHTFTLADLDLEQGEYTGHVTLADNFGNVIIDVPDWQFTVDMKEDVGTADGDDENVIIYEDEQFPDDIFRNYLKNRFGISKSERLTSAMLESITDLIIPTEGVSEPIKSIEGIQYLKNLTFIVLEGHDITDASMLSELTQLENICMDSNELIELPDFSNSNVQNWYNTSFVNNRINPESITLDKTPENMYERDFFVEKNKKSQRREFNYSIPTKFYAFEDKNPFLMEVDGFKGDRIYTLTVDMGDVTKEKTFYREGTYVTNMWNYQKHIFVIEDMGLDEGEYTAHITLTDHFGNVVLDVPDWTFTMAPDEEKALEYVTYTTSYNVFAGSIKIEKALAKEDIQSIKLVDKNGNVVGSIMNESDFDCQTSQTYEEERYDDIFDADVDIELTKNCENTEFWIVIALADFLEVGSYDVVIETPDDVYTFVDLVKAIDPIQVGNMGDAVQWTYNGKTKEMAVTGEGEIPDYEYYSVNAFNGIATTSPMNDFRREKEMVLKLDRGITKIGNFAFYGLDYLEGNLTIPEGVTEIGQYAFADSHYNGKVGGTLTIPSTTKTIGENAFSCCTGYDELIIAEGVETISTCAFMWCQGLDGTTVKLPNSLKEIAIGAFSGRDGNLKITFECSRGGYAEKWALENGFDVIYPDGEEMKPGTEGGEDDPNVPGTEDGGDEIGTDDGKDDEENGDDNDIEEDDVVDTVINIDEISDQTYTGSAIKPLPNVYDGKKLLTLNKDYTISYKNNKNVTSDSKKASVIIKGKGNYEGTYEVFFNIVAKNINPDNEAGENLYSALKTGNKLVAVKPTVVTEVDGKQKKLSIKDYKLVYNVVDKDGNKSTWKAGDLYESASTYSVVVTGTGNYTGTIVYPVTFVTDKNKLMSNAKITIEPKKFAYAEYASGNRPSVEVKMGKESIEGQYTIIWPENVSAGKVTVTVVGDGENMFGSKSATFTITGKDIKKEVVFSGLTEKVDYTGEELKPSFTLTDGEYVLRENVDFTATYTKNIKPGTAKITIAGIGAYEGKVTKTFKIDKVKLEDANVSVDESAEYTKTGAKANVTVTVNGKVLAEGTDYKLTFKNNKEVGEATVMVTGKGGYTGKTSQFPYEVTENDFNDIAVDVVAIVDGKALKTIKTTVTDNGKKLNKKEYTISYKVNGEDVPDIKTKVEFKDEVTVVVTANKDTNYVSGAVKEDSFRVGKGTVAKATVNIAPQPYTGKEVKLDAEDFTKIKVGGKDLVLGTDFEIVDYENNVDKGNNAKVIIRGINDYCGTKTVKFKISTKKIK